MLKKNIYLLNCKLQKKINYLLIANNHLAGKIFLLSTIIIIITIGIFIFKWMNYVTYFKLFKLDITGNFNYNTNNNIYKAVSSLGIKSNFMSQDVNVIKQKIETLPFIKHVSVRKKWPNEIYINVMEYIPIVNWNNLYMLDANGELIEIPSNYIIKKDMPVLYGPKNSEKKVLKSYNIIHNILKLGYLNLKLVLMTNRKSWIVVIDNNISIKLGRNNIINRIKLFMKIYPILLKSQKNNKKINYVDLRYNSGAAIGWLPTINKLKDKHKK